MQHHHRIAVALLAAPALVATATAQPDTNPEPRPPFERVERPGSVNIETEYDVTNPLIPLDQVHTLLPRDAIPALTDPDLVPLGDAGFLDDDDRLIVITVKDETVAVPLKVLNFHEVANLSIASTPIAATYCPLCDSATAIERTITLPDGSTQTLEFAVSGALYNSNVLMYDRTHMALWSQVAMKAVTGPLAGTEIPHLPIQLLSTEALRDTHPDARVVSTRTGHDRPYAKNPYAEYFENQDVLLVPVAEHGDALPKKTLGLGIKADTFTAFVPASAITERFVIQTPLGDIVAIPTNAGVRVVRAPKDTQTVQSLYYAFSAFHPDTVVITESSED